ncbi:TIGR02922 family protein [Agarivorans sp. MS3-6]|uniref:TIGR02922 family protein n=1 Tax=Agarivorans sp. TSD2052 TaxID=2937286 RepID=UPI00200D66CE|nr:TIGR02922 family protein [Agarivorans sp. TSD2052]UPW18153.1 TIGR02922 family protein [Agarivorans sp. TSD2052]
MKVTMLYYDEDNPLLLQQQVLSDLCKSSKGRVIIPNEDKEGKIIIAILEGEVKVLNSLGDRAFAAFDLEKQISYQDDD